MALIGGGVSYTFSLRDQISPQLSAIMMKKEEMMRNMGMLPPQLERVEGSFNSLSGSLRKFGGICVQISIMSFVLNLTQRRLEHTQEAVRDRTEALEKAIARYGIRSVEAERATRDLALAKSDLSRASFEARLQMVLGGFQAIVVTSNLIELASKIKVVTILTSLHRAAIMLWNSAAKIKVALLTAMATGAAAVITFFTVMAAMEAATAAATSKANNEFRKQQEMLGTKPSSGLVKSIEDVVTTITDFRRATVGLTEFKPIVSPVFEPIRFEKPIVTPEISPVIIPETTITPTITPISVPKLPFVAGVVPVTGPLPTPSPAVTLRGATYRIGGLTLVLEGPEDLEAALKAYNVHVRRELRRLVR